MDPDSITPASAIVPFVPGQWRTKAEPTVVFIDDDFMPRRMMGMWLSSLKINNTIFASLQDLERDFPENVDLVISDGYLDPEKKTVRDVVKAVRARGFVGPVVLVSQSAFTAETAYDAGASLFLQKPLRKDQLLHLLNEDTLPEGATIPFPSAAVEPSTAQDSTDSLPDRLSVMEL